MAIQRKVISISLLEDEAVAIKKLAASAGMTVSEFMRKAAMESAQSSIADDVQTLRADLTLKIANLTAVIEKLSDLTLANQAQGTQIKDGIRVIVDALNSQNGG